MVSSRSLYLNRICKSQYRERQYCSDSKLSEVVCSPARLRAMGLREGDFNGRSVEH